MAKGIDDINERIRNGEAVVYTAEELKVMIRDGEKVTPDNVDVVTTGTCGLMSGTAAIFTVPVAQKGVFKKARNLWLNDVPAFPGPCPNESLGVVDIFLYGTSYANRRYGGGHLLRDIVAGEEISVRVESEDGRSFENSITIDDLLFSRMVTTRTSYRNYVAFLNTGHDVFDTIFSVAGLRGPFKEATISGCGEVNPVENDPDLLSIGVGTKILINGGEGYVMGQGTRSTKEKPVLSVFGEMRGMDPQYMGGFKTSATPEVINTVAIPLPFTEETMRYLMVTDEQISLPIADIHDRVAFTSSDYGCVWQGTDVDIRYDPSRCQECDECEASKVCPTDAITPRKGIDKRRCFNCGACVEACPNSAYIGRMGSLIYDGGEVPISLRQSNRSMANRLCRKLRDMINDKEFYLTKKVGGI
ncbi:MAG TPA: methanogenesis marker 16 metalloprotein [Candidatus Methanofastidiosa archaeon]|nr:methanogenesis marker 16 metalloprotein [Candidatus Methanofastidiosa archaeon]